MAPKLGAAIWEFPTVRGTVLIIRILLFRVLI